MSGSPTNTNSPDPRDPEVVLANLGIEIPRSPPIAGNYVRARITGNLLYLAGHLPDSAGSSQFVGKLGRELSTQDGYQAARISMINSLGTIKANIGSLKRVKSFIKMLGMVNCTAEFVQLSEVVNGASDLLAEVFGKDVSLHARSAVGMNSLPRGNCVEIETIIEFQ